MSVATIPLSAIDFGERRREDYGDIEELAASIKKDKLIQPLAVMKGENGKYLLLAGGRRYKALTHLGMEQVHVRIFEEALNELQIRVIELAENFFRKDLEWEEQTALQKEIHQLHQQLHGVTVQGVRTDLGAEKAGWTLEDTANLVGRSVASVQKDIRLADAVEKMPEVFAGCKNKNEAQKRLSQMQEELVREELAKRAQARAAAGGSKSPLIDKFILRDFFAGVEEIPDGVMNLVEVDPPYGIELGSQKARGENDSKLDAYNEIDESKYEDFLDNLFSECYRVMADHSWIICWFAHEPWFETVYQAMKRAGFKGSRMVGIWKKPTGQTQQPNLYLANTTEMFFYMRKGSPTLNKAGATNVFEHAPVPSKKKIHPTERPLDLIKDVLDTFTFAGARVLVPFLGSGKTLIAAQHLGMTPVGFELSKQYKDSFIVQLEKGIVL